MTRKALGRGLEALLSAEQSTSMRDTLELDTELIDPGSTQPRTHFDEAKLEDLAQSIRSNGIVQPLLVRQRGSRYELIAGERRWRAARLAGLKTVPAVVREVEDDKLLEIALIENIQREDLNPIEEAKAYRSLIDTIGLTQDSLAARVGRDRSYITNYLRLLRLPIEIQKLLQEEKITTGHARAILGVGDSGTQNQVAQQIISKGLSVRETERIIGALAGRDKVTRSGATAAMTDPNVRAFQSKLRRHFGTKVKISQRAGGEAGFIQIEFYSASDLNRICDLLLDSRPAASSTAGA